MWNWEPQANLHLKDLPLSLSICSSIFLKSWVAGWTSHVPFFQLLNEEGKVWGDLLLVAGEQVAIGRGSLVLAQELLLEEDPPFHSFSDSRQGDTTHAAVSRLCDPRGPRWRWLAFTRWMLGIAGGPRL